MQEFKIVILVCFGFQGPWVMVIMKIYIMHGLLESEFQILYTLSISLVGWFLFLFKKKSVVFFDANCFGPQSISIGQ